MNNEQVEYCRCEETHSVYSEINDWGWWYRCCTCNKVIEGSFEYHSNELDLEY